jgi:hypothetical protein
MIWNLIFQVGAGYFGSGIFEMTSKGILTCAVFTAIIQGIDMYRFILEVGNSAMENQPRSVVVYKAVQMYVLKILFYGSITLFVASISG